MNNPAKFTFGQEFNTTSPNSAKGMEQEINTLRTEMPKAEARGYEAGKKDANTQLNQTLILLANSVQSMLAVLDRERNELKQEAIQLCLLTARTLAGHILDREPAEAIREFASSCIDSLRKSPHVVFRVHPDIVEGVEAQLKTLSFERGLEGRLIVLGDPDKNISDCKIEWADGGFERNRTEIEKQITDAVTRYMSDKMNINSVPTETENG
ncbi:MAG: FliH/SctL family protein [Pseudomonadota bacterium]